MLLRQFMQLNQIYPNQQNPKQTHQNEINNDKTANTNQIPI